MKVNQMGKHAELKVIVKTISRVSESSNSLKLHCLRCDKLFVPKSEHDRYCLICSSVLAEIWRQETKEISKLTH